jgi:hypothetical protein
MRKTFVIAIGALAFSCASGPEGGSPAECADGIDQDNNGLVDCEDPGCAKADSCVQQIEEARRAEEAASIARVAAAAKSEEKALADELQAYFEVDGLWVQEHHNGANVNQAAAKEYCEKLVLAGKDDWRLPTEAEAIRAFESGKLEKEPYVMWTKTMRGDKRAIILGITSGATNDLAVRFDSDCRARCVRGK